MEVTTSIQVRGYELDGYGHVNHAVYLNYAEVGRGDWIQQILGGFDAFTRAGLSPVVVRVEVDYRAPCFLRDTLGVVTEVTEFRRRTVTFKQRVLRGPTRILAAELLVTVEVVNSSGRAVEFPPEWKTFFVTSP